MEGQFVPWKQIEAEVEMEEVNEKSDVVTAKIRLDEGPHTFDPSDSLTWAINGGLEEEAEKWTGSFEFFVDELPSA